MHNHEAEEILQMAELLNKMLTLAVLRFANNTDLHKAAAIYSKRMLDAYIAEGFTREEALAMVIAWQRMTTMQQSK